MPDPDSRYSASSATSDDSAICHGCCPRLPIQRAPDYTVNHELPTLIAHIGADNAVKLCSCPFFKDEASADDAVED